MTIQDAHVLLRALWPEDRGEWLYIPELRVGTGYRFGNEQRIDAFVIGCWPSRPDRIAIEIKLSRGDFARELATPNKRLAAWRLSNEFYFAAPAELNLASQVPPDAGFIELTDGRATVLLDAPYHDGDSPSWLFVASLARKLSRKESDLCPA